MKTDAFEKRLQQLAPRDIPSEWRSEILAAAEAARPQTAQVSTANLFATMLSQLASALRGHRLAWGGLAAAWLIIGVLNLSGGRNSGTSALATSQLPTSATMQALRREKLTLLAELTGIPAPITPAEPRHSTSGPRSQWRPDVFAV